MEVLRYTAVNAAREGVESCPSQMVWNSPQNSSADRQYSDAPTNSVKNGIQSMAWVRLFSRR